MRRLLGFVSRREPPELDEIRRYSARVLQRANEALERARERMDDRYDERRRGHVEVKPRD